MAIDRNVFNQQPAPEAQLAVDAIKNHYHAQGKKNAAESYPKLLRQWLLWGQAKGWTATTMPPDAVELFLAEKGSAFTTTAIMRNVFKAILNIAPTLGIELAPQVLSAEKYKKKGTVRLADGTIQSNVPDQPFMETPMPDSNSSMPSLDVVDISDNTPVAAPVAPPQPPIPAPSPVVAAQPVAAPPPALQSVQHAIMGGARVVQPKAPKAPTAPAPTSDEKAAKALLSTAPFFRISRVSDGSDPRIPPGMTTFVGVFPSKDLILNGDIPDFLQRHVVPKTQIRPGTGEILFVVEELDSHRRPTGRREEFPISVPFGGGMNQNPFASFPQMPAEPAAPAAPVEPSRTEDIYLKRLEEKIAAADEREAELQKKLHESTNMATTMMLMSQMQREQDLRRELEDARSERSRPPMNDPFAGLGAGLAGMGGMAPPSMNHLNMPPPEPAPRDDSMKELIKILAERAFAPPPPPPPQRDPMEMMMTMMTFMEKLKPAGPSPEVVALAAKVEAMASKVEEKLAGSGTKTLKDQLADLVAVRQTMEALSGGGNEPSTLEMLAQNAEPILQGVANIISAGKGGQPLMPEPVPVPRRLPPAPAPVPRAAPRPVQQAPQQVQQQVQVQQQKKADPPGGALAALAIMENAPADSDQEIISAFVQALQELANAGEPFATMFKRLLNALQQSDVMQDIYAIVKTMFYGLGKRVPHKTTDKVAKVLHRHYTDIYKALFGGVERRLEDADDVATGSQAPVEVTANGATDEEEASEDGDEDGEDEGDETEEDEDGEDEVEVKSSGGVKLVS